MGVLIASLAGGGMSIMTTRRRSSPKQIVRLFRQVDKLLASGEDLAPVCQTLGISQSSIHRRQERYGGMNADEAKRLKGLEAENATLKRMLADAELKIAALTEVTKGKR